METAVRKATIRRLVLSRRGQLDPADAIYSAARYLCAWGAGLGGQSLYAAIFAYNHADWYVREVIRLAVAYS